jgi:hypothetical protein
MRPMDATMIDEHLENIDQRLTRLEQILPTLATKEELEAAIAPLATKEELRATEAALRGEIREAAEQSRRHMTMLIEHQDTKLQLIAEHVLSLMDKRR